jgi:hypothetical protein
LIRADFKDPLGVLGVMAVLSQRLMRLWRRSSVC